MYLAWSYHDCQNNMFVSPGVTFCPRLLKTKGAQAAITPSNMEQALGSSIVNWSPSPQSLTTLIHGYKIPDQKL